MKPTVEASAAVAAEAHLFDFVGRDLYGERIRLAFVARLRDERRFPSVEALRAQIARGRGARARAPGAGADVGPGRAISAVGIAGFVRSLP